MNTLKSLVGATLVVAFAGAGLAQAGTTVQPAEFGRDGAPRVTVTAKTPVDAVHVQAFGRESPGAQLNTRAPTAPDQARNSALTERFGRS
jgi:hypothetical protein